MEVADKGKYCVIGEFSGCGNLGEKTRGRTLFLTTGHFHYHHSQEILRDDEGIPLALDWKVESGFRAMESLSRKRE
jgi:hypothetical protein